MNANRATCRSQQARRLRGWIWLVALATLMALAGPAIIGRVYTTDDLGEFHLPLREFYAERLAANEAFDWLPSLYCGFFVTGEGQLGGYHPLHWILYRSLPLALAFDLELLLSYPCLLLGSYALLRRLVHRRDAALLGAIAFTFSGFSLLHFIHPNAVAVIAHLPWLLLAIDVVVRPATARRQTLAMLAIALLTGSQLLLGYPQYVWFSLLVEMAFVAWRLGGVARRRPAGKTVNRPKASATSAALVGLEGDDVEPEREHRYRLALRIGLGIVVAKLCGALLGAQQLAPTYAALQDSCRQAHDAALANSGALHPLNLTQFFAPYLFTNRVVGQNTNELGLYCGVVPTLLVVWLWTQRAAWGRLAPLARWSFALVAVGLLPAIGEHGYLYTLQQYIPLANRFRFPCRAIVIADLGLALLTAVAWSELRRKSRLESFETPNVRAALLVCCGLAILLALVGPLAWPEFTAAPWKVWAGPALFLTAAFVLNSVARRRRWAAYALPALLAADLAIYGLTAGAYRDTADLASYRATTFRPPFDAPPGARVVYRGSDGVLRDGNRLLLTGLARADGYAGLEPQRKLDYQSENVQRAAGVCYRSALPQAAGEQPVDVHAAGGESIAEVSTSIWIPIINPLPRARLVTQIVQGEPTPDLSGFDLDRFVVTSEPLTLSPGVSGQATIVADSPR